MAKNTGDLTLPLLYFDPKVIKSLCIDLNRAGHIRRGKNLRELETL